jgi:putative ABC transport system permease protein
MPDVRRDPAARFARALMALLPERGARELFEPAWHDMHIAHLAGRETPRSATAAAARGVAYALRVLLLYVDCWRLLLADVGRRPEPRARPRVTEPPSQERLAMLLYHVRHAFRQLVREPAFTVAAVLTLALGVGANVAVFAVVEAVLLRPLGYADEGQLTILNHRDKRTAITKEFIAVGDFIDMAARQTAFERLSAYGGGQGTLTYRDEPFNVQVLSAGTGLLELLRVRPILGRTFTADDGRPNAPLVALLGYDLWKRQFGGDPRVVGQSLQFGQQTISVVGVMPQGFTFPPTATTDIVVPFRLPLVAPAQRRGMWIFAIGRLEQGRTLDDAAANLAAISRQLEKEFPQSNLASEYFPVPLRTALVGNTKPALVLLLAAVGVVLLIACANVANLLLARSLSRRREMSVRMALGAGRGRLAVQLLTESLALSAVAGIGGVVFATWGSRALVTLLPQSTKVPGLEHVRINASVMGFALLIVLLTAVVFGLVAALTVRSESAAGALNAPSRSTMSTGARRATSGLVIAEVALAVMLLIGAGLILRSFSGLLAVDPGFKTDHVMTVGIQLPPARYREIGAREGFYTRAFAALRAAGDVREIGSATVVPLTGNNWTVPLERPEQPVPAGERPPEVGWQSASGGYFKALQIPLIAGRLFDERDRPDGPPVVIVSEAIQRRFFANESAVGKRVKTGDTTSAEIVGVVGNIRRAGLRDDPRADMYFPAERVFPGQTTLFIRTSGDPNRALTAMQNALKGVEPRITLLESRSLEAVAAESVRVTKLVFLLLGVFATTALALAAVGIYGVMSYVVRQRTREIGTRIALGATRRDILWLVLRQGAVIAVAGTAVGLATGLAATRFLASILYGVSRSDPVTLSVAVSVLVATVMAACYVPARRAASVDPAKTLAEQ